MNEFVTVSESKTATAHEIFNSNSTPIEDRANKFADEHFAEYYSLVKEADLK